MGENKDKKFINEKIVGRNLTWRRILKYVFLSIFCGAVFGAAAFFVFWFSREKMERSGTESIVEAFLGIEKNERVTETDPEPVTETEPVTVPETVKEPETEAEQLTEAVTEPETETEPEPVTEPDSEQENESYPETKSAEPDEETSVPETEEEVEPVGDGNPAAVPVDEKTEEETESFGEEDVLRLIEKDRAEYEYTLSDYRGLSEKQKAAVEEVSVHFVTVECVTSETTWFESTIETKHLYSGVILSKTDDEILVLSVPAAAAEGVQLSVRFSDGTRQDALVKMYSERDRLVVLAVPTEGLGKDFLENVSPIEYARKKTIVPGTQIITAGAPLGIVGSYDFGYIGYVSDPVSTVDGSMVYCLSDVNSDVETGTFFTDLDGKLIGVAEEPVEESRCAAAVTVESIEYIVESLKKGREMAYLGISGMDTSFEMKYKKIPEGMYVTEIEEESPAFEAGMKQGDILTLAGTREIRGTDDYKNFMRNLRPGEAATMKVMRAGAAGEYKELELTLTAGIR